MSASLSTGRLLAGLTVVALLGGCAAGTGSTMTPTPSSSSSGATTAATSAPVATPNAAVTTPECTSDTHLMFEPGGERLDVCGPTSEAVEAGILIWVRGKLPSSGPWGSGEGTADFFLIVDNRGATSTFGTASISYQSDWGTHNPKVGTWSWAGFCSVTLGEPAERLTYRCDLRRSTFLGDAVEPGADPGIDPLVMSGDAPLPAGLRVPTIQATYRIEGGVAAEGTVPVIRLDPRQEPFNLMLEDGRLLQLWLAGSESDPAGAQLLDPDLYKGWTTALVNFGDCQADVDPERWIGTFRCPGSTEYESMAPATLDLTLEPLTP